jgi:hypothetical protein
MANRVNVTLPPFWADNAAGRFAHVEARFRAKQIFEEWDRFDLAVAALGKEVIHFAVVTHPDGDEPYTRLKEDLLQQHTLTKYLRIKRLHAVGGLGSRRPSQLLAEMMELCPNDKEASCLFVFLFLQRLPAWLRVQLESDDQEDIRWLVTRADRLIALHGHKHSGLITVAESAEDQAVENSAMAVRAPTSAPDIWATSGIALRRSKGCR